MKFQLDSSKPRIFPAIDIVPCDRGRALCREFSESYCDTCLAGFVRHSAPENIVAFEKVLLASDPVSAVRIKQLIEQ
jgi:hypothetical protein